MIEEINKSLKNTKITKENKKLKIVLLNEGWITEVFLILQILKKNKYCDIKGVYQVYKEEKMIIKELIESRNKLINLNYPGFVNLIKNETKTSEISSGRINWNKVNEIEIRLVKELKENKDLGFKEEYVNILIKEVLEFEIS
jgi:hypothetical protein